ncbi:MAG: ADOP family duplicated permease [Gemmatimonadales bacterium]
MRRVFRLPFTRSRLVREIDDELAFHLEQRTARLVATGWSIDAARAEATRHFGDVEGVRQSCVTLDQQRERAMQRADLLAGLKQDLVYAVRTLRRNVVVSAVIVVALATGIGANTAIFTLVDAVLVRTLPVAHPNQLVAIGNPTRIGSFSQGAPRVDILSYPLYRAVREQNRVFSDVLASGYPGRLDVRISDGSKSDGGVEHPRARFVSGNYFSVLGLRAAVGRTFEASADSVRGAASVATISYGYWTRRFQNDPSVVGRTILVNGTRVTIVGVAPAGYMGEIVGAPTELWLPIGMHDLLVPTRRILDDRTSDWLLLLGRLRPGVTIQQAAADVRGVMRRDITTNNPAPIAASFLGQSQIYYVSSGARGFSHVRPAVEAPLVTLMIGVALLLCIICANVANLLLARGIARGREMAVRLALGANRARLVRQLLTESALLALLSTGVGLALAWWGTRMLLTASGSAPGTVDIGLDGTVLAFTSAVSILAVALFGVVPAIRASRVDLASTMRSGASAVTGSALATRGQRAPLGRLLIAGQVALSVVLLVGAAMLVRSLRNVQSTDVGLDRDHLVVVDLDIGSRAYSRERLGNVVHELRDRIAALPGVAAVTYSANGIFSGSESNTTFEVPGFAVRDAADTMAAYDQVGPHYISAIGGRIVAGRDLEPNDEGGPPRVALVNETLARFYFPNENAVGKYLRFNDSIAVRIVGVAADTRDHSLLDPVARRVYFPYVETDTQPGQLGQPGDLSLEVRVAGDPSAVVQPVRRVVAAIDPLLAIGGIEPLRTTMESSIQSEILLTHLASAFGVLALSLAAIGLYGVMSYAITRRTGEMGLRVALGAQSGDVMRLILFDAARLVIAGVVVGLPLALASARLLRAQLHGVETTDPVSIAVAVVVLTASALVAAFIPALRAARVPPVVALRAD